MPPASWLTDNYHRLPRGLSEKRCTTWFSLLAECTSGRFGCPDFFDTRHWLDKPPEHGELRRLSLL